MKVKNQAGFVFVWPEGSPYVEVYHPEDFLPEYPMEVVKMTEARNESNLKQLAFSTGDYSRF